MWRTTRARFSSVPADALCGVTNPTNTSFPRRIDPKTPDICSSTLSEYTDSRVSKAMKARKGRSDFGSWNSTFDHFRSESTFVPSMWRTVRETSADPRVAASNTRTCADQASRKPVEGLESRAHGVFRQVVDRFPDLGVLGPGLLVDTETRGAT